MACSNYQTASSTPSTTTLTTITSAITSSALAVKHSDTQSEVSESGTVASDVISNWGSREDLREFVHKHGYNDISELYQDRFRVDRKHLEQMLSDDNNALMPADVFFSKIMEDTDTYITWPSKLKLGAKSKKDPHVRIAGNPDNVKNAKDRIMAILYTRCNRVTMKMDISYTDHSHIIGRGGLTIKRVMEETQCHVHFPDSNRSNPLDKSNQVSISGDIESVECARSRVRELIPVIFGFEPPIMSQNIDQNSMYVIKIQEQYNVQVMFKTRPKLHATIVLVKGTEWEVEQVKQATLLLKNYICRSLNNQIPVQMSIQISPQHHQTVLGKNHANLKAIMEYTKCQIMFPDAQDHNIPNLKKSNITISGNINNVYKARQLLIGSLPLLIIFDLPENAINLRVRPEQITEIQNNCDVYINIRQKARQVIKSCIIKGIEKDVVEIYKARNFILGKDEPPQEVDIPAAYHLPPTLSSPTQSIPVSYSPLVTPTNVGAPAPFSPILNPLFPWHYPGMISSSPGGTSRVATNANPNNTSNNSNEQTFVPPTTTAAEQVTSNGGNQVVAGNHHQHSYQLQQQQQQQHQQAGTSGTMSVSSLAFQQPFGPYSPLLGGLHPDQHSDSSLLSSSGTSTSTMSKPSPNCSATSRSPNKNGMNESAAGGELQTTMVPNGVGTGAAGGNANFVQRQLMLTQELETNQTGHHHLSGLEYENKRFSMTKAAMQNRPSPGAYRVPTGTWVGYGLSHTSPARFRDEDIWRSGSQQVASSPMNTSNVLEQTPINIVKRLTTSSWSDLPSLLADLNLDSYIDLFVKHEVDMATFATLSDEDLRTIGVTAFGSRRKMLLAISELNKRSNNFSTANRSGSFSAAPGAERKCNTPTHGGGAPRNSNW